MNRRVIIFSVLISVISILLAVLQYYYTCFQKITFEKKYDPFFRDLIISPSTNYVINYKQQDARQVATTYSDTTATDAEVRKCLEIAMNYKLSGKLHKALRLYEHAAIIAPNDPDVLTKYGEFLEWYQKDVISADELYLRALIILPDHTAALANRKRTSHLVDTLDLQVFNHLDEMRDRLKVKMRSHLDYEAKKLAFYLHIYHTVGIEGNTMTMAQLKYILETGNAVQGKSVVEHNEILGLKIALHYVKTLTGTQFITGEDILEIHRRVMGYVDPLTCGQLRDQQVFVGSHIPPPPEDLLRLMDEYISWLNSEEALALHPVRLAALAHYKLVEIHPFIDGNGRTSRLIMNLILLKFGYPPVIINKDDRQKYYDYLKIANIGDVRPFVRFIAYCTDETLTTYLGYSNRLSTDERHVGHRTQVIELE